MKIVRRHLHAFTLIELLVVLAIITLMAVFAVPALSGLMSSKGLANAAYGIGDSMQEARAYAMGNNTYVFLGIGEFDASKDPSVVPQVAGNGRLVVIAVASKDGLLEMDDSSGANNLSNVFRPRVFENIHMPLNIAAPSYTTTIPTVDVPMARPNGPANVEMINNYAFPTSGTTPDNTSGALEFAYPLPGQGPIQYPIYDVIVFDPQGSARLLANWQSSTNATEVRPDYLELDLQSTHGVQLPVAPTDSPINYAAVQFGGLNGSVHVYR